MADDLFYNEDYAGNLIQAMADDTGSKKSHLHGPVENTNCVARER